MSDSDSEHSRSKSHKKHRRHRSKSPKHSHKHKKRSSSSSDSGNDNPRIIGPALPSRLNTTSTTSSDDNIYGLQLPPQLQKKEESESSYGPSLPPHLKQNVHADDEGESSFGPSLPAHLKHTQNIEDENDDDDDDVYGPLPPDAIGASKAHIALEERALQMKIDRLNPTTEVATRREEWMLELPAVKAANLGLGPRQFRAKEGPDMSDRSSWTDTPSSKKAKGKSNDVVDLKKEAELKAIKARDREQEEMARKAKRKNKRDKSLLEQHQDKLKKKQKKEESEGTNTRRPFSRDVDLKVNRFDEAQKKSILKKAQLLDDRFSQGQSKFL